MKMKAPLNSGGASHPAHGEIAVDESGVVDVPAHLADDLRSHGFSDYVEPPATEETGDPGPLPPNADQFDMMNRTALFAWVAANGGGAKPAHKTAELRDLCRDKLKTPIVPVPQAPAPPLAVEETQGRPEALYPAPLAP